MYKDLKFSQDTISLLMGKYNFIQEELFDKIIIGKSIADEYTADIKHTYQNIIYNLCKGDIPTLKEEYIRLTHIYIDLEVPYLTILNEHNHLETIIMETLINYDSTENIITLYELSKANENLIAKEYFNIYTKSLLSICNSRISNLNDMVEQYVIDHYESHLYWLIDLTKCLQNLNIDNFPETDKTLCEFGKWLVNDAKNIVQNNSKLKELDRVHSQLHHVSIQIKHALINTSEEYNYDILLTYLEKAELLSLSIGSELALIDNTIINQKSSKDALTGALTRNVLTQVFHNQYELSLATNTKFVVALCDLDHFKNINDTYGHVAGDKMLQGFVQTVQETLRSSDIIIRYGGEEFFIILPALNKNQGLKILEKIRTNFEQFELIEEDITIQTTVSIGFLEIEPKERYNDAMMETYIRLTDENLYIAKNSGRNKIN
jgi:diguanylate cyclase